MRQYPTEREDIAFFILRRSLHRHLRRIQHIFNKNAVARGGVVYHDVGDCADELAVLDNGLPDTSAVEKGQQILAEIL